jgi:hypothetical protein
MKALFASKAKRKLQDCAPQTTKDPAFSGDMPTLVDNISSVRRRWLRWRRRKAGIKVSMGEA